MSDAIPQEVLEAARRRLCRRFAAVILEAMADADISFTQMAYRIGKDEPKVRGWFDELSNGRSISLDCISDMLLACAAELDFRVTRPWPGIHEANQLIPHLPSPSS